MRNVTNLTQLIKARWRHFVDMLLHGQLRVEQGSEITNDVRSFGNSAMASLARQDHLPNQASSFLDSFSRLGEHQLLILVMSIHSGWGASTLACNAGCHGFAPQRQWLFWDLFSQIDAFSGTEEHKWSVWHWRNFLWPVMSAEITGKNYFVTEAAIISTGQSSTHTHKHTWTHTSWWLVLGWVTTK